MRTAFVGNMRFENVMAKGAPGLRTRPTSAKTSTGRVRYCTETLTTAPSNSSVS